MLPEGTVVWEPCLDYPQPCYNNKTAFDPFTFVGSLSPRYEPCFLNNTAFEPTPYVPEPCTSHNSMCDDTGCDENFFGEDIQAAGVGIYLYIDVDTNRNTWGVQYYLCAPVGAILPL